MSSSRRHVLRRGALATLALLGCNRHVSALQAADRWPDERTAGPFVCHADFPLESWQVLIGEIGRLSADVQQALGIGAPQEAIHLFLFAEKATYHRYLQQYYPDVPDRRALFIKHGGPGMVFAYQHPDFPVDLRHESTHAVLHAYLPMVPLWLDEGLAEYFEMPPDQRAAGHPHRKLVSWQSRLGAVPSLHRLEAISDLSRMGTGEYRTAWAWTHFMLHGPPVAYEELRGYLADVARHTAPGQLSERLNQRIPDLNEQFIRHFRQSAS